jgi:hypothetical protein
MEFDFCTISSIWWLTIAISSICVGGLFGFILKLLFRNAGFGVSASRLQTFSGGCLLPVALGLLATYGFIKLIPDDPCGGAFTPDSYFVFEVILPLTTLSAVIVFFAMTWRRG